MPNAAAPSLKKRAPLATSSVARARSSARNSTASADAGWKRLLEDVLDPNRNVDRAFRMTIITKNDGTVTSGLVRKDEGDDLLLVNQQGQEFTVKKADIDERAEATTSLMPSVAESLPESDLIDLMAYLLKHSRKHSDLR